MKRLLFIITTLDVGGAERVFESLLYHLDTKKYLVKIICLSSQGVIGQALEERGFEIRYVPLRNKPWSPKHWLDLMKVIRSFKADIVHTWMYHACFVYHWLPLQRKQVRKIWSIHNTNLSPDCNRATTLRIAKWLVKKSVQADKIVYVSEDSQKVHEALGYEAHKSMMIHNGIDTDRFLPQTKKDRHGKLLRVALVSRDDPQKNVDAFFEVASRLKQKKLEVEFVCYGQGLDANNKRLKLLLKSLNLGEEVKLLGVCEAMEKEYPSFDLLLLPSRGETLPNVVAEAMSAGVYCVANNVGDTKVLIAEYGACIEVDDIDAMTEACLEYLAKSNEEKEALAVAGRKHIQQTFALDSMLSAYQNLYESSP